MLFAVRAVTAFPFRGARWLREILYDTAFEEVRLAAIYGLGLLGDHGSLGALERMLMRVGSDGRLGEALTTTIDLLEPIARREMQYRQTLAEAS